MIQLAPHKVIIPKGWVHTDKIRVEVWQHWCATQVELGEWMYLSTADPLTHNFYFDNVLDAVAFKLAFSS